MGKEEEGRKDYWDINWHKEWSYRDIKKEQSVGL